MLDYLYHHNANTHWAYPTSAETDAALLDARSAMADFLNCSPSAVAFGANMTTLTFHVARAMGRTWSAGDEIIVTDLDHHANIDPWKDLAAERDLKIRTVPFDAATGQLDMDALDAFLGSRTRLVAIGAASNALGTITDVSRVAARAREAGAWSFVDAVHYAPHVLPDVQALGCDFFACSPYKFYGPHSGVLYGKPALLESLQVPRLAPAPSEAPERLETGTLSHEAIVGAAAAVDFLASLGTGSARRERLEHAYSGLHTRAYSQMERLWSELHAVDHVHVYGPAPSQPRTPTLAFTVDGYTSEAVCAALAEEGLFLSHGDFYAMTVVDRLGVEGLVRVGCACYTSDDEVNRLLEALRVLR